MINRAPLFLFFSFISIISYCQKDLREGYVINNSGDTIHGMINFQGDMNNSKECEFYTGDEKTEYHPFDINGYRFEEGKYYVSRYVEGPDSVYKIFAEYLVRGKKDLFYYRDYTGFHYLLSSNDSSLIIIPHKREAVRIKGKNYFPDHPKYMGFLKAYFSDCPPLYSKIEKLQVADTKGLISITKEYHDIVCGENSCVIYKKSRPKLKFGFEPRFEMMKFNDDPGYTNISGMLLKLWLPESNENLFLKTGLIFGKYEHHYSMWKVPFQFEYLFPAKIIRPKLDLGLNYYQLNYLPQYVWETDYLDGAGLTLAGGGGIMIRATKFLYVDLNVETDIKMFSLLKDFFIIHTFGVGVVLLL